MHTTSLQKRESSNGYSSEGRLHHKQQLGVSDPAWLWAGRVPSLDGIRAVSIVLVLWNHAILNGGANLGGYIRWWGDTGNIGVSAFFVISGFLITLLLVREQARTSRVSFGRFWLRRIFRIVPAYIFYVTTVGFLLAFSSSALTKREWIHTGTYSIALFSLPNWFIAHTWSLSVEEHFYLLWPIIFSSLRRRLLILGCVMYSIVACLVRAALYKSHLIHVNIHFFTPTRGDAIAIGCALALVATSDKRAHLHARPITGAAIVIGSLITLCLSYALEKQVSRWGVFYANFAHEFVIEWCVLVIVWYAIYHANSPLGRLLNCRALTCVGVLSYSLYLWQQPFLGPIQPLWMFKLPGNLLVILLLAMASYLFVEQPFLRLKSRLEPARGAQSLHERNPKEISVETR